MMCLIFAENAMIRRYQVLSFLVDAIFCFHRILSCVQFVVRLTFKTWKGVKCGNFHPFLAVEFLVYGTILFHQLENETVP